MFQHAKSTLECWRDAIERVLNLMSVLRYLRASFIEKDVLTDIIIFMEQMSDNLSNVAKVVIGRQNIQTHRSHWKGERHGIYIRVPKALHAALQAKARTQNKLFNDVATGALAHGLQVNIG